jgi:pilus assembly protein CpaD
MTSLLSAMARRRGAVALRVAAAVALSASLGGCFTQQAKDDPYPTDYRLRHPIRLAEGEHKVEIFLGRNRGGLTPSQRADVLAFAQSWRREATGGIIIDIPHGGPTDRAADDSMREVHSILAASGVPSQAVYLRGYRPSGTSLASIKISYSKIVATAGPCGTWPHDLGPTNDRNYNENRPYWNFGCASQRNLAAMVDNPADLVQPRGETPVYAARRSAMMDKYRKGDSPSAIYPNDGGSGYQSGKITDAVK